MDFSCDACGHEARGVTFPFLCLCGLRYRATGESEQLEIDDGVPVGAWTDPELCLHRGEPTGETRKCTLCGGREIEAPVHKCRRYGECTTRKWAITQPEAVCLGCRDWRYEPTGGHGDGACTAQGGA